MTRSSVVGMGGLWLLACATRPAPLAARVPETAPAPVELAKPELFPLDRADLATVGDDGLVLYSLANDRVAEVGRVLVIDAAMPAAPAAFLPAKLDDKHGVVFAETKGGTVEATGADKAKTTIPDGTVVEIAEVKEADMSTRDEAAVDVVVGGKTVTVPAARVLLEANLQRSPDAAFAVMSVIERCGDLCHTIHYIVAADGKRAKIGDGVVDIAVGWSKDGKQAAIGSGQLWLVSLPDLAVRAIEKYTAPAYGPDGVLYVRDNEGSVWTGVEGGGKAKRVWKSPWWIELEDDYGADDPPPVNFDASGKPDFKIPGPPWMPE